MVHHVLAIEGQVHLKEGSMSDLQESAQLRMRREHLVCKIFATLLYKQHGNGKLDLESDSFRSRIETISRSSLINNCQIVINAFGQVTKMTQSLALRKAAFAMTGERKKLFITDKAGSLVQQDLTVFRELCAEMLLECEPGDFNVTGELFQSRIFAITEELKENDFTASEVAMALHEVYRTTFEKYLQEQEKKLRELDEKNRVRPSTESGGDQEAAPAKPYLRVAAGE